MVGQALAKKIILMTIKRPIIAKDPLPILRSYKIAVIGNSGIEKTHFLKSLRDSNPDQSSESTIGADVYPCRPLINSSRNIANQFVFFDCSGRDEFAATRAEILRDMDAVVLCYNDKDSYISLESRWVPEIGKKSPIVVCCLQPCTVPTNQARTWSNDRGFHFCTVSKEEPTHLMTYLLDALSLK